MKFIIDRKTWLRGEGAGASYLLRPSDGRMCCLGSILLQCGLSEDDIREQRGPDFVPEGKFDSIPEPLRPNGMWANSTLACNMMNANDRVIFTEDGRESHLISLAAAEGIELEFVD